MTTQILLKAILKELRKQTELFERILEVIKGWREDDVKQHEERLQVMKQNKCGD